MNLIPLAQDPECRGVGCPSVHLDRDSGQLIVQGDGVAGDGVAGDGVVAVRLKATIVHEALWPRAKTIRLTLPADRYLVVSGDEFDVSLLPDPLPGERAVWSTTEELTRRFRLAVFASDPEDPP